MEKETKIFDKIKASEKPVVAPNYFSDLEKELHAKIEFKPLQKKTSWKLRFYIAASVAAILLLLVNINLDANKSTPLVELESIKDVDINTYIEENISDFNDELFLEVGFITASEEEKSISISDIEINELENYLSEDDYLELNDY